METASFFEARKKDIVDSLIIFFLQGFKNPCRFKKIKRPKHIVLDVP